MLRVVLTGLHCLVGAVGAELVRRVLQIKNLMRNHLFLVIQAEVLIDGKTVIIHSPGLDLSGYGKSLSAATKSFKITLEEFLKTNVNGRHWWKVNHMRVTIHISAEKQSKSKRTK